jgi:23S rRNA pseudouridine1911/1915/1917 synthase
LAELSYRKLAVHGELWLIEIQLFTGRKHQIRVQLAAANCPILGDRKYGSRCPFKTGVALHSRSLTISHPTRKTELTFQSTPPKWWNLERFGVR